MNPHASTFLFATREVSALKRLDNTAMQEGQQVFFAVTFTKASCIEFSTDVEDVVTVRARQVL